MLAIFKQTNFFIIELLKKTIKFLDVVSCS